MKLIKRVIDLSSIKSYVSDVTKDMILKDLSNKGCHSLNSIQLLTQNHEHVFGNWGEITATTIYLKIELSQTIDDQGIFTDMRYDVTSQTKFNVFRTLYPNFIIKSHSSVFGNSVISHTEKLFLRLSGSIPQNYYIPIAHRLNIVAFTDSKLFAVRGYNDNNPYQLGVNFGTPTEPTLYLGYDATSDSHQYLIDNLLSYHTFDSENRYVYNSDIDQYQNIPVTTVSYMGEAWNQNNLSICAHTKEEKYFGIIFPPEVENYVFIDRGRVNVFNMVARLGDISNIVDLEEYENKFYNIIVN